MNKIILLISLSLLIILGCEPEFDNVIDVNNSNYQVLLVAPTGDITYVVGDSVITVKIDFTSQSEVDLVTFDIVGSDGKLLNSSPVRMFDNGKPENGDDVSGDNKFAEKFSLRQTDPVGKYTINFYVEENGNRDKVALANFNYDNGQTNVAPVISNDIIEPDTVVANDTVVILNSVMVLDPNGLNDVEQVYFIVNRPDSSTALLDLFDDGDLETNGDSTAGDGIYSRLISVNQNNTKGTYRFDFQARDRGGLLSNTISHFVVIQ